MASLPGVGVSIRCSLVEIIFCYYFSRQAIDVFASLFEHAQAVVAVEDRSIWARLQAPFVPWGERTHQVR